MPKTTELTLKELLARHTKEGELCRATDGGRLECYACGHRCKIGDGHDGICKVRFNRGGKLYVPYGYAAGIQLDPIEKKPFFHALPGSTALSFGMLGCDYHCGYCQNWVTSQALRDPNALSPPEFVTPEDLVGLAFEHKANIVTSTYNEPLITSEWAVEIFKIARQYGFITSYVSNGNGTPEVIEYLKPWIDLYKVDLKGYNDKKYRSLGGVLQNVLDTIKLLYEKNIWVEIVTLVVPGFNDSDAELRDIAKFIASVSPDIPWHVTAFHSDYKMNDTDNTTALSILHAREIGLKEGLHFVYAGNAPGRVGDSENTYCPSCNELLIQRWGFRVQANKLKDGHCPKCGLIIPGVWKKI
jgi:pyruvate formate lyase activating enzyme